MCTYIQTFFRAKKRSFQRGKENTFIQAPMKLCWKNVQLQKRVYKDGSLSTAWVMYSVKLITCEKKFKFLKRIYNVVFSYHTLLRTFCNLIIIGFQLFI